MKFASFLVLLLAMVVPARAEISQKREMRGVWIASVANIDWPSKPGLTAAEQQRELVAMFDHARQSNLNAVFVQVRPCADAFYPSRFAPWSQYLSGTQGRDPGYDPLAFMVTEAHKRGLQLHAWFNPYRVSLRGTLADLAPNNPARLHPDWVVTYGGKMWFNPGLPAVKELLEATILEVVKAYEIDGVHFDDYFYPYPEAGQAYPDAATYQQYGGGFATVADWRRDNVNRLVQSLHAKIKAVNPEIHFGISPFGVWRNKADDPTGSDTRAGVTNYDSLYADTRTWIKQGWIDYIAPQLYWNIGFAAAAYEKLVPWWTNEVAGTKVSVYIGHAAHQIGNGSAAWNKPDELPNQLKLNRRFEAVKGSIYFRMKSMVENKLGWRDRLIREFYAEPALPPALESN
jgi:uncharacterized lipoprotein YddW (UPF0748 family)